MRPNMLLWLPLLIAGNACADLTLTTPKAAAKQIVTGSAPFNDEWTNGVDVQLSAKAVSNGEPGLFIVLGSGIICDSPTFDYARSQSISKTSVTSYTLDLSAIDNISEWRLWTNELTDCRLKYRAEALSTSTASSWSVTGAAFNVSITWTSGSSVAIPPVAKSGYVNFQMRKTLASISNMCD